MDEQPELSTNLQFEGSASFKMLEVNHEAIRQVFGPPEKRHEHAIAMEHVGWVSGEPVPPVTPSHWWAHLWWWLSGSRRRQVADYRRRWREWDEGGRKPVAVKTRRLFPRAVVEAGSREGEYSITVLPNREGEEYSTTVLPMDGDQ